MDINLYYPFGIRFYEPIDFIDIIFINNESTFIFLYFEITNKLSAILPPFKKRKYQFPKNSKVWFEYKKKKILLNLKMNMIYFIS